MRAAPPELPGSAATDDSPVDRGLAQLLAGELEAALRWSAAAIEYESAPSSSLILTCRLLSMLGRTEAAIQGFDLGLRRAVDAGSLPLAVAAASDLRQLGENIEAQLDLVAAAFCKGSPRLSETDTPPPPLPVASSFQPLSPYLSGPALLSKATSIIHAAQKSFEVEDDAANPCFAPVPLFSMLDAPSLRALIACFSMITVPAGHHVIREGEAGAEAYIVARGELEVRRSATDSADPDVPADDIRLARLNNGALFGEMALLSRAPRAASVITVRPSILLVATRDAIEAVASAFPNVGFELAAHCRRRMVANLVRTSPVLRTVRSAERSELVDRFETRVFAKGEKLVQEGTEVDGLHLIASGEVALVAHEKGEPVIHGTLGPGDTAGEVPLVLRRKASCDVVATHPTVTLFLPRNEFVGLVRDHPAILHGLYLLAVKRDEDTISADEEEADEATDYVLI